MESPHVGTKNLLLNGLFSNDMDNGQLYELFIWALAGFLILLIVVLWSCYYWASFRLRREERRHRSHRSNKQSRRRDTTTTLTAKADISMGGSVVSRPRIVLIDDRDLVVTSPSLMVGDNDVDIDCASADESRAAMSVGSLTTYLQAARVAADRLGSNPRRAMAAAAVHPWTKELDSVRDDFSCVQPQDLEEEDEYGSYIGHATATDGETPPVSVSHHVKSPPAKDEAASVNSDDMSMYLYEA